ncbi:MAG: ABC transporter permease subunit [Clostridia bacterium]|nr:ABC transporter permease subunit [Clostridia bacterium]
MLAIYKRELRAYFVTPIGYVCLAIFLAASAFLFSLTTLQSQTTDMGSYFMFSLFVLIIVCALLTMRLFAEEKKMRTEQLLMTAPISITGMVTAKFLAAETVFAAGILLSALNVIPLYLYAEPYTAQIVGNYVAFFLVGSSFVAIGIFMSSLTENQLAAAVATIGVLFFLLIMNFANSFIDLYIFRYVIDWLSIYARYQNFTQGIFDYNALLYYASICFVFLFLTVRVYEKRRWA